MYIISGSVARTIVAVIGILVMVLVFDPAPATDEDIESTKGPEQIIDESRQVLRTFLEKKQMQRLRDHFPKARGIIIVPKWGKAGLLVGFGGGKGVMLTRAASGDWRGPVFYDLGAAGLGLQIGVSVSQVVMLVMTDSGVQSLLQERAKMGAAASVAAGPVGTGAGTETAQITDDPEAVDIVTFVLSKGLYAGFSAEGSTITYAEAMNKHFYGKAVTAEDILVKGTVKNPKAQALLRDLAEAARGL
jgi:lipid-binding SYLF domain-containing protein